MNRGLVLLAAAALAGCFEAKPVDKPTPFKPVPEGPAVGNRAPVFDLRDHTGKRQRNREWEGRSAALLLFGTTMCPKCQGIVKQLDPLRETWKDRLTVAAVLLSETAENAEAFERRYATNFPLILDPQNSTMTPYALKDYPYFVLIDRKGIIRYTGHEVPAEGLLREAVQ